MYRIFLDMKIEKFRMNYSAIIFTKKYCLIYTMPLFTGIGWQTGDLTNLREKKAVK